MDDNNRNLLLAILLSALVLFCWEYFVAAPQMKAEQARQAAIAHPERSRPALGVQNPGVRLSRIAALELGGERVPISTPTVDGSLLLKGARFDDLRLKNYRETTDPKSPETVLLAPKGADHPYFADFGWIAQPGSNIAVPSDMTVWECVSGSIIAPGKHVRLRWDNGHGLVFTREVGVDDKYMFTVIDSVKNVSS